LSRRKIVNGVAYYLGKNGWKPAVTRKRKPVHWSQLHPPRLKPSAEIQPDTAHEPQDEAVGQGAAIAPAAETAPAARKRRPPPRNYADLKLDDEGR